MKYVALLRGINVGTSVRINMKELRLLFERNGYSEVTTYINSGNVLFQSATEQEAARKHIEAFLFDEYGQSIRVLVLSKKAIADIAGAIPAEWHNDDTQKTDVAYLFDTANDKNIVDSLPVKKNFIRFIYVDGALIWNVARKDYNKSQLNKIISHKIYKEMTVRNVNTARYLASAM